jgi:RNA polymerase sigma-70 factor, ECF subfamily
MGRYPDRGFFRFRGRLEPLPLALLMATATISAESVLPTERLSTDRTDCGKLYTHTLGELFREYEKRLLGFIRRKSGLKTDAAEEIAQETWLEVHRCWQRFDPARASFATWLFMKAKDKISARLTRRQVKSHSIWKKDGELNETGLEVELPPDELLEHDELRAKVQAGIESLSQIEQQIAQEVCLNGGKIKETAEKLGLSMFAAERRIKRVYRRLAIFFRETG